MLITRNLNTSLCVHVFWSKVCVSVSLRVSFWSHGNMPRHHRVAHTHTHTHTHLCYLHGIRIYYYCTFIGEYYNMYTYQMLLERVLLIHLHTPLCGKLYNIHTVTVYNNVGTYVNYVFTILLTSDY